MAKMKAASLKRVPYIVLINLILAKPRFKLTSPESNNKMLKFFTKCDLWTLSLDNAEYTKT